MNLETAKILGMIGIILRTVGVFIGGYVSPVGLLLMVIAVYGISSATNRPEIFRNYILSFVAAIVGVIILLVIIIGSLSILGGNLGTNIISRYKASIIWVIVFWIFISIGMYFL